VPHGGKENDMDEKKRADVEEICRAYDEASMANKKYLLGYAEGFTAGTAVGK
jgi:flagellar biosynthesis/type III secretory pathway protein FliH